ncbi:MAG: protein kinase domain-containing protein [Gammaproteobacteria bacterium]
MSDSMREKNDSEQSIDSKEEMEDYPNGLSELEKNYLKVEPIKRAISEINAKAASNKHTLKTKNGTKYRFIKFLDHKSNPRYFYYKIPKEKKSGSFGMVIPLYEINPETYELISTEQPTHVMKLFNPQIPTDAEKEVTLSRQIYPDTLPVHNDNGYSYFAMPYAPGIHLYDEKRAYMTHEKVVNMSYIERVEVFLSYIIATEHMHRQNIIHCDLKAANMLIEVTKRTEDDFISTYITTNIIDFGLSYETTHPSHLIPYVGKLRSGFGGSPGHFTQEQQGNTIFSTTDYRQLLPDFMILFGAYNAISLLRNSDLPEKKKDQIDFLCAHSDNYDWGGLNENIDGIQETYIHLGIKRDNNAGPKEMRENNQEEVLTITVAIPRLIENFLNQLNNKNPLERPDDTQSLRFAKDIRHALLLHQKVIPFLENSEHEEVKKDHNEMQSQQNEEKEEKKSIDEKNYELEYVPYKDQTLEEKIADAKDELYIALARASLIANGLWNGIAERYDWGSEEAVEAAHAILSLINRADPKVEAYINGKGFFSIDKTLLNEETINAIFLDENYRPDILKQDHNAKLRTETLNLIKAEDFLRKHNIPGLNLYNPQEAETTANAILVLKKLNGERRFNYIRNLLQKCASNISYANLIHFLGGTKGINTEKNTSRNNLEHGTDPQRLKIFYQEFFTLDKYEQKTLLENLESHKDVDPLLSLDKYWRQREERNEYTGFGYFFRFKRFDAYSKTEIKEAIDAFKDAIKNETLTDFFENDDNAIHRKILTRGQVGEAVSELYQLAQEWKDAEKAETLEDTADTDSLPSRRSISF